MTVPHADRDRSEQPDAEPERIVWELEDGDPGTTLWRGPAADEPIPYLPTDLEC